MKVLTTIEGLDVVEAANGTVRFIGDVDVDIDGVDAKTGKPYDSRGDKYYQAATSLRVNGQSLDARVDRYVVVPQQLPKLVRGVVLGCKCVVEDMLTNTSATGVVGDLGPTAKVGEVSCAMALALGLNDSPVNGGSDQKRFRYTVYPDTPAFVNGKLYPLQPLKSKA